MEGRGFGGILEIKKGDGKHTFVDNEKLSVAF